MHSEEILRVIHTFWRNTTKIIKQKNIDSSKYVQSYEGLAYITKNENNQYKFQNCRWELFEKKLFLIKSHFVYEHEKFYRNSPVKWFAGKSTKKGDELFP